MPAAERKNQMTSGQHMQSTFAAFSHPSESQPDRVSHEITGRSSDRRNEIPAYTMLSLSETVLDCLRQIRAQTPTQDDITNFVEILQKMRELKSMESRLCRKPSEQPSSQQSFDSRMDKRNKSNVTTMNREKSNSGRVNKFSQRTATSKVFHTYHNDMQMFLPEDIKGLAVAASKIKRECKTREPAQQPGGKYPCLRKCGFRARNKSDFLRHQNSSQLSEIYVCNLPAVCMMPDGTSRCSHCETTDPPDGHFAKAHPDKKPCTALDLGRSGKKGNGRITDRKDHFRQHLRTVHKSLVNRICPESARCVVSTDSEQQCGFCGTKFDHTNEWIDHILAQFDAGKTIHEWREPWAGRSQPDLCGFEDASISEGGLTENQMGEKQAEYPGHDTACSSVQFSKQSYSGNTASSHSTGLGHQRHNSMLAMVPDHQAHVESLPERVQHSVGEASVQNDRIAEFGQGHQSANLDGFVEDAAGVRGCAGTKISQRTVKDTAGEAVQPAFCISETGFHNGVLRNAFGCSNNARVDEASYQSSVLSASIDGRSSASGPDHSNWHNSSIASHPTHGSTLMDHEDSDLSRMNSMNGEISASLPIILYRHEGFVESLPFLKPQKRPRGRTGPLDERQRKLTAKMRSIGACQSCRHRKAKVSVEGANPRLTF